MSSAHSRGTKAINDNQPVPGTRNGTLSKADERTVSSNIVNFLDIICKDMEFDLILELELQTEGDHEAVVMRNLHPVLHLIAVGHPPESVDSQDSEYVRDSRSHLDVGAVQFAHLLREQHHSAGFIIPDDSVVLPPYRTVSRSQRRHFPPLKPFQQWNLAKKEPFEIMLPEEGGPKVGSELIVVHAVEGMPRERVGSVALVDLEHGIGAPFLQSCLSSD